MDKGGKEAPAQFQGRRPMVRWKNKSLGEWKRFIGITAAETEKDGTTNL